MRVREYESTREREKERARERERGEDGGGGGETQRNMEWQEERTKRIIGGTDKRNNETAK